MTRVESGQLHPCLQYWSYTNRRLNFLEVAVLDVLLDLRSDLRERHLFDCAAAGCFRTAANNTNYLRWLFDDYAAREIVQIPGSAPGLFGPFGGVGVLGFSQVRTRSRQRAAEENSLRAM